MKFSIFFLIYFLVLLFLFNVSAVSSSSAASPLSSFSSSPPSDITTASSSQFSPPSSLSSEGQTKVVILAVDGLCSHCVNFSLTMPFTHKNIIEKGVYSTRLRTVSPTISLYNWRSYLSGNYNPEVQLENKYILKDDLFKQVKRQNPNLVTLVATDYDLLDTEIIDGEKGIIDFRIRHIDGHSILPDSNNLPNSIDEFSRNTSYILSNSRGWVWTGHYMYAMNFGIIFCGFCGLYLCLRCLQPLLFVLLLTFLLLFLLVPSSVRSSELVVDSLTTIPLLPDLSMIHLDDMDAAGHLHGWGSKQYHLAAGRVDRHIERVFHWVKKFDENMSNTMIFVISDHGGIRKGHGENSRLEKFVPFFMIGGGALRGKIEQEVTVQDLTPTILTLFNLYVNKTLMNGRVLHGLFNTTTMSRTTPTTPTTPTTTTVQEVNVTSETSDNIDNDINADISNDNDNDVDVDAAYANADVGTNIDIDVVTDADAVVNDDDVVNIDDYDGDGADNFGGLEIRGSDGDGRIRNAQSTVNQYDRRDIDTSDNSDSNSNNNDNDSNNTNNSKNNDNNKNKNNPSSARTPSFADLRISSKVAHTHQPFVYTLINRTKYPYISYLPEASFECSGWGGLNNCTFRHTTPTYLFVVGFIIIICLLFVFDCFIGVRLYLIRRQSRRHKYYGVEVGSDPMIRRENELESNATERGSSSSGQEKEIDEERRSDDEFITV